MWYTFVIKRHHKDVKYEKDFKSDSDAIKYAKENAIDFVFTSDPDWLTAIYSREKEEDKMSKVKIKAKALRPTSGCLLHIQAGDDDYWQPSPEEMDDIASMFERAIDYVDHGGTAVVVTRNHVEPSIVKMFNVENTDTVKRLSDAELKGAEKEWQSWNPATADKAIPWGVLFKTDIDKLVRLCVMDHGANLSQAMTVCRQVILDMMHQRGVTVRDEVTTEGSANNLVTEVKKAAKEGSVRLKQTDKQNEVLSTHRETGKEYAALADRQAKEKRFNPVYDSLPPKRSHKKKVAKKAASSDYSKKIKSLKKKIKFSDVLGHNAAKTMRNALNK